MLVGYDHTQFTATDFTDFSGCYIDSIFHQQAPRALPGMHKGTHFQEARFGKRLDRQFGRTAEHDAIG